MYQNSLENAQGEREYSQDRSGGDDHFRGQVRLILVISLMCITAPLVYYQSISEVVSYLSLIMVMLTLFMSMFVCIGGVLAAFTVGFFLVKTWAAALFFLVFSGLWNWIIYGFIDMPIIASGAERTLFKLCIIATWAIGFAAPLWFFQSFKEFSNRRVERGIGDDTSDEEDQHAEMLWSRRDENFSSWFHLIASLILTALAATLILICIFEPDRGAIYVALIPICLGSALAVRLKYLRTRSYHPLALLIPQDEHRLVMRGSFLGECVIEADSIAAVRVRTWETTTKDNRDRARTIYHSVLELLLHDGGVQQLEHLKTKAEREKMMEDSAKLARHFSAELRASRGSTGEWAPSLDEAGRRSSQGTDDIAAIERSAESALADFDDRSDIDYSSAALTICEHKEHVEITYRPPLTSAGRGQLHWAPSMYALIGSGTAGLISLIGADLLSTMSEGWIVVIAVSLVCLGVVYRRAAQRVKSLSYSAVMTLKDDGLTLQMSDHASADVHYEQPAEELRYARVDIDLEERSATLSVGTRDAPVVLMYIAEGWFEGQVDDLMRVERLIEDKYGVV